MDVLQASGRRIPDDVGVVGFDDSTWALRCDPPLSTVRQPASTLGRAAADAVLRQLRGAPSADTGVVLDCPVVWRASA
ncbi:substrate-binding domain-containing protein [Microbacterium dauci]|uniref:substrate-binding domain-containing protein n=1 Tax=Microbacterium dauci TaxID=3048008 RepID=UPI003D2F6EFF